MPSMSSPAYVYFAVPAFSSGLMAYFHGALGAYWAETGHPAFASWAGTVAFVLTGVAVFLSWFAFYLFAMHPNVHVHAEACSDACLPSPGRDADTPAPVALADSSQHRVGEAEVEIEAIKPNKRELA